ncbi:MAG: transposase [Solirubrobacteraceae bacterium]
MPRTSLHVIECELPRTHELPLSRFSRVELHRLVIERGVTEASASTIWRWLHEDAIKPWQTRSWIFPRDPDFAEKAARALDLYARRFEGKRLRPDEYVTSADEMTQLQALGRHHQTVAPGPGRPGLVEFEYLRGGTLAYLAAWDVHHANLFDRIEHTTGIVPFGRLVDQVMKVEPYRSARTVYWVVDNGSSHAGDTSVKRIAEAYSNARRIHLPVHASWLNQIEIYFSIVQAPGPDAKRLQDAPRTRPAPDGLLLAAQPRQIPMDPTMPRDGRDVIVVVPRDRYTSSAQLRERLEKGGATPPVASSVPTLAARTRARLSTRRLCVLG